MKKTRTIKGPKRRAPVAGYDPDLLPVDARTRPEPPFVYVHYSNAWEWDDEHAWIPELSKLVAMPGVNGTDHRMDLNKAIQGAVAKGGTYINPKDKRLLLDGEDEEEAIFYDYARYYECVDGRMWWVEVGQEPTVTLSNKILWNKTEASRVVAAFKAHLRDTGMVEPMHELVLREKVDAMRKRADGLRARAATAPHLLFDLKAAEKKLEGMEKSFTLQVQTEALEGTRKPRRKRAK